MVTDIAQTEEFDKALNNGNETLALYFYGDFSDKSQKMLQDLHAIASEVKEVPIYSVNVSQNKELHKRFNVKSVPTIVLFKNKRPVEWIQGEQSDNYIKNALKGESMTAKSVSSEAKTPKIIMYTTPTCSFCDKMKAYLRKLGFPFQDIDVSKDSKAADELMQKTGQTGVPQTFINGQHIVGFDQKKIDKLLGISA